MKNSQELTEIGIKKFFFSLKLVSVFIFCTAELASAKTDDSNQSIYDSGNLYLPTNDQMGANWCHDSRGLAQNLYLPDIKEVIDKNYELLFIDVGYYTNIRKVINRFEMPIIYSTPTTLIIDPNSEKVINKHNMLTLRDAASVSPLETQEYFEEIVQNREHLSIAASMNVENKRLSHLNHQIDQFENHQAERIYKGFSILGPMIIDKKAGKDPKNFQKFWEAVSKLRYAITDDLEKLRKQALEYSQDESANKELVFPNYPPFDWEI